MESIVSRIRKIAKDTGLGEGNFEKSVGQSVGYLNITEKRQGNPSVDFIQRIIKNYPEYSLMWLFTGSGDMKLPENIILNEDAESYGVCDPISLIKDQNTEILKVVKDINESVLSSIKEVKDKIETLALIQKVDKELNNNKSN